MPKLSDFLSLYPELELDISFNDRFINLITEGIDVAVRIGKAPDSSLVTRRIGRQLLVTCAAPAYFERFGRPQCPQDLHKYQCLKYRHPNTGCQRPWQFHSQGKDIEIQVAGKLSFSDREALVNAAQAQLGIIQVPSYSAIAAIKAGVLEAVLADYRAIGDPISAVWPSRRHITPKVRVFVDFLITLAAADPAWEQTAGNAL